MNWKKVPLLILVLIGIGVGVYAAVTKINEENLEDYLRKVIDADKQVTYTATVVNRMKWDEHRHEFKMRLHHQAPDKTDMEFISRSSDGKKHEKKDKRGRGRRGPRELPGGEELRELLGLSDEQVGKFDAIRDEAKAEREKMEGFNWEAYRKMREKYEEKTRAILSEEQQKKYDEHRKKRYGKRGRGSWGGGRPSYHRGWKNPITDVALLIRNYHVDIAGTDTVAGRPCRRIEVKPRYKGRPSCTFWADQEKFLLLKFRSGEIEFEIETIEFDATIDPRRFEEKKRTYPGYERREIREEEVAFRPEWLPAGFRFQKARYMKWGSRESHFLVYADGLTTITLIQSKQGPPWMKHDRKDGTHQAKRHRRGNVTMLNVQLEDVFVTVMGSIPEQDLLNLLSSLKK